MVTFRTICVQSVQDQVEWGFEQPGVAEGVTAHGREVGKKLSLRSLPTFPAQRKAEGKLGQPYSVSPLLECRLM